MSHTIVGSVRFESFQEKNEYGAEVRRNGRPMPVEYLIVDVPAGLSKNPTNSFAQNEHEFLVENRVLIGQIQVCEVIQLPIKQYRFLRI